MFILYQNLKIAYSFKKESSQNGDVITIKLAQEVSFLNKAAIKSTLGSIPEGSELIIDASSTNYIDFDVIYQLLEQQETDLTPEQTQALKELVTYYPVTNISVNSEQLDGYTVFNYPISMANGWNYVKQQLNDNRDYIYDMDAQSAEAYVNSEYAVALTELEV